MPSCATINAINNTLNTHPKTRPIKLITQMFLTRISSSINLVIIAFEKRSLSNMFKWCWCIMGQYWSQVYWNVWKIYVLVFFLFVYSMVGRKLRCPKSNDKYPVIVYSRNHSCWRSCNVETQCASCYGTYFSSRIYPTAEVKRNVLTYIISNALLLATLQLRRHFISYCQWFIQSFSEDSSIFHVWMK